jgi:hypothetical protein
LELLEFVFWLIDLRNYLVFDWLFWLLFSWVRLLEIDFVVYILTFADEHNLTIYHWET